MNVTKTQFKFFLWNGKNICSFTLICFIFFLNLPRMKTKHRCFSFFCLAAILVIVIMARACSGTGKSRCILPGDCTLQTGDVVFRRGSGVTSRTVIALDQKGEYSHVGIVVDSAGVKMVVHAVPGEPDYEGDPDRVKMDTPETFFSSVNAQLGEVCRPKDSLVACKAAEEALKIYRRHTLFDHDYDDRDTTRMYCTELVVHAFRKAGVELVGEERHHMKVPILEVECMFPSDLLNSDYLGSVVGKFH